MSSPKTAIVLFNLGGPDSLKATAPFLFNLFCDPAIIRVPAPLRQLLAAFITLKRTAKAKKMYAMLGGRSPIIEQTRAQAFALEAQLSKSGNFKVFFTMRYWKPRSFHVACAVRDYAPDRVVLLPLYPQYSTTTTASSVTDWYESARKAQLTAPTSTICCYPTDWSFAGAYADLTREAYFRASQAGTPRVLFSAHGLPEKIVNDGDPYQWQIEQSVKTIVQVLAIDDLDYRICYQSRVGPLEWIGPATDEEIRRAGADGVPVVIVPVAFVSEHSETRYELDIEYARLARESGVPHYVRVPALSAHPAFIEGLASLALGALKTSEPILPPEGMRMCPARFSQCMCFDSNIEVERKAA